MNTSELKDRLQTLYNPDLSGTKRRANIKAEHYAKVRASAKQRDEEIEAANKKHAENIVEFDKTRSDKLEKLDKDVKDERRKQQEFDCLLGKLNDWAERHGKPKHVDTDFAPSVPAIPQTKRKPTELSMGVSFSMSSQDNKRKSDTLKQATSKKARLDDQYGSSPDQHGSGIEKNPIVLKDKPFLYISSWEIAVEEENIRNFRKMVETFNFFPTVRADDTGYFFIFDDTPEGDRLAEDCYDRLKGWRFRKQRMNMKLYKIGEEREHYL